MPDSLYLEEQKGQKHDDTLEIQNDVRSCQKCAKRDKLSNSWQCVHGCGGSNFFNYISIVRAYLLAMGIQNTAIALQFHFWSY